MIKEEIKLAFTKEPKGTPLWLQETEWSIGTDNRPMIYIGQEAYYNHSEYYFRDANTGEQYTITQWL